MKRRSFFAIATFTAFATNLVKGNTQSQKVTSIDSKLAELGVQVKAAKAPVASYIGWRKVGNMVYIAGQVPTGPTGLILGKLGENMTTKEGYRAARACAVNILSQLKAACAGNLDRVKQCVQIQGFVNSANDYKEQHLVLNGTSELFYDIWGEAGLASRAAVGTNSLPLGIACEVLAVFEIA